VATLCAQAQDRGDATAYRYLADGVTETRSITFAELHEEARGVAARLQEITSPGSRALLLAEDAVDFARAFVGCQLAGVIAVPVSPPFPTQRGRRVETLRAIAGNCGAEAVLTSWPAEFRERVESVAPELGALEWLAVDTVTAASAGEFRERAVDPHDVAFLQYTSGSTSIPKGVVVTHEMLAHNEAYIQRVVGLDADAVSVSWLPLFHDMGLIGVVLGVLYSGHQAVIMPPAAFARWPRHWLQAISTYRGTASAAPDSAYRLCVEKIGPEDRVGLDLRSWRTAVTGAEPVLASTLDLFAEAFGPCGFRRDSWLPTYGLAESTLMASGPSARRHPVTLRVDADALREGRAVPGDGRVLVGCGTALMHRRIEIVDPASERRCEPGEVGEIWLAGTDVARSYWELPEASEHSFNAQLAGGGGGPFLRTGDVGFMLNGELYVTGRIKDVIIVAGRNHYPHDIEATAMAVHPALVPGGCAVYAVDRDGRERVVVAAEVRSPRLRKGVELELVERLIRAAVASEHDIAVADVLLVERKSVPRTSSGKLQRTACRAAFERGELVRARSYGADGEELPEPSAEDRRRTLRRLLLEQVEGMLSVPSGSVDTSLPFRQLGLDSLMTAELRERLQSALGEQVSPTLFFAHPTTDRLIEQLLDQMIPLEPPPAEVSTEPSGATAEVDDDLAELDEQSLAALLAEEIETSQGLVRP
jgi:acyl-CoA synthetase (AMP-forming)/AMP-acid ligase II